MSTTIAIIDYGIGNVKSICNALKKVGGTPVLTKDENQIKSANAVILPGVGAFGHGMELLQSLGLDILIRDIAATDTPILGICLGMQLLFEESEEFGIHQGLGLIKGKVKRMPIEDSPNERLPHVSWNEIRETSLCNWTDTIFEKTVHETDMYFVHSYICEPSEPGVVLAETEYGAHSFCSAVKQNNIYGCQFHPEKSGEAGLKILDKFVTIAGEINE